MQSNISNPVIRFCVYMQMWIIVKIQLKVT